MNVGADYPGVVTPADLSDTIVAASKRRSSAVSCRCQPAPFRSQSSSSARVARVTETSQPTSPCGWPSPQDFPRDSSPRCSPRHLAEAEGIAKVEVAGPGFVNITLESAAQGELGQDDRGGRCGLWPHRDFGWPAHQP